MYTNYFYAIAVDLTKVFTIQIPGEPAPFTGTWAQIMNEYPTVCGQVPSNPPVQPTPVISILSTDTAPSLFYNSEEYPAIPYEGQRPTWPPAKVA